MKRARGIPRVGLLVATIVAAWPLHAQITISTNRYDGARTGANLSESRLTTSNVNVTQFGMQVQQAVEAQRFSSADFPNSFAPHDYFPGRLCIEEDMPNGVIDEMKKRGHDVQVLPRLPAQSGAVCAVMRDPQTGMKHAGADPRREAYALGW